LERENHALKTSNRHQALAKAGGKYTERMTNKKSRPKKQSQHKEPTLSKSANQLIWQLRKDEPKFAGAAALGLIHHPHAKLEVNRYTGKADPPAVYKGTLFQLLNIVRQARSDSSVMTSPQIESLSDVELGKLDIINQLIENKDYKPDRISSRKSDSWSEVADILAGMPFKFRTEALNRYEEGIRVFGKVPVRITEEVTEDISNEVLGPARPMGCPEPPPEGAEFYLAWREGNLWNWNLDQDSTGIDMIRAGRYRPGIASECTKYFKYLLQLEFKRYNPHSLDARRIVDLVECCDDSLVNPDTATGFYAGVLFSRLLMYAEGDSYYATRGTGKKSEWSDIIAHALDRHGWATTAKNLLIRFEGRVDQSKFDDALADGHQALEFPSCLYLPEGELITTNNFSQKVKDVKKRRKPQDYSGHSHLPHLEYLLKKCSE
jgi:hypothetical protein